MLQTSVVEDHRLYSETSQVQAWFHHYQLFGLGQMPLLLWDWGFPGGLEGKASACKVGDPGLIQGPGWEDPLEKEMATHSSILAWKNPMDQGAWQATVHGVEKSWTRLSDFPLHFHFFWDYLPRGVVEGLH